MLSGLFSPLKNAHVSQLWWINLLSNIGTFGQLTAAIWLMKQYNSSNFEVGLVHIVNSVPMFFLGLVSGILIDRLNKNLYLFTTNLLLSLTALGLGICIYWQQDSPFIILSFCFIIGVGTALTAPAWQATMSMLVPRDQIKPLAILNGLSFNMGRIIGASMAGFLLTVSLSSVFFLNAFSYFCLSMVFFGIYWRDRKKKPPEKTPDEKTKLSWWAELQPLLKNKIFRALLTVTFFSFMVHTYNTLLPILVLERIDSDEILFGQLMSLFGLGTLSGGFLLPTLLRHFERYRIVLLANVIAMLALLVVVLNASLWVLGLSIILSGACWVMLISSLNGISQYIVPSAMRGKAIAVYLMAVYAGTTIGGTIISYVSEVLDADSGAWFIIATLLPFSLFLYYFDKNNSFDEQQFIH